jgi:Zn-finger nucleic acid-binding protein
MSERSGIEIDYCPECRGVWLDRGELDKIIERAAVAPAPAAPVPPAYPQQQYGQQQYGQQESYPQQHGQYPYKKKRENWLSELFD